MKKLVLSAAILAALSATAAQATIVIGSNGVPVINPADTNILYLSGASAAEKFIEGVMTNSAVPAADRICDTSKKVYKFQDTATTSQYAYLCERATTNASVPTNKANILIYKRSAGGSAFGVSPLIAEANGDAASATIAFLKIDTSCTVATAAVAGTTLGKISCAYNAADAATYTTHIPDFGISDVDPGQFTGSNAPLNPATGAPYVSVTSADVAKLTIKSASTLVFGVPVTKNLYFALQAAQKSLGTVPSSCVVGDETEACMPSLSSAQIATIHAGTIVDWNQLKVGTVGLFDWATTNASAYLPTASYLHTCRRENGSGTQAQSNIKFLGDPCTSASLTAGSDAVAQGFGEGDGLAMVHENNSSGVVDECLNELQDGTNTVGTAFDNSYGVRWAVGIQSMEKKTATTSKYRFVKVDSVAPTLANVVNGKYRDWAENTFQYGTAHVFSSNSAENTALKALTDAIIKSSGAPEVMAKLNTGFAHTFIPVAANQGAYMAVPSNYAIEANGAFLSSRPVNPYSHATPALSVNNCRVPSVYSNGTAPSGDTGL
ncbi:hypothetical protein [Methylobacter psychrophilus]|uniref:hypothetical protein n=1 Tax=Methylobacter psychrophilus TaxID=96941 RepID=UPI0021D4B546|nr:hypothetical protein [Methylobacter psychrophilus]